MPRFALPLAVLLCASLAACNCGEAGSTTPPDAPPPPSDAGEAPAGCAAANPCTHPGRTICRDEAGQAVCDCDPGRHLAGDECVADERCSPTSCAGHGTCTDATRAVVCACDAGWTGTSCQSCDQAKGFHADGAGGCTTDVCKPNPCTAANTVCTADGTVAKCGCKAGYHDQAGACVVDEVCTATSCAGHGTCTVASGRVTCACATGYAGAGCAGCATGYHPDGAGGCTNDPCLPNPCTAANKAQCAPSAQTTTGYVCGCDPGYHDDGVGNCTTDPCKPNPCAAQNKACQANGTGYTCVTPVCDDQNPCTTESVVNGACAHAPLADGSTCSTTTCKTGEKCTAGACGGGAAVVCNDNNPCTADSCVAATGCRYTVDNALVPDDGVACTTDACLNGTAQHTPKDSVCDDGKWCTGVERCAPADPSAVSGCVHTQAPKPPALPYSPCASYGACNEASQSFTLVKQPAGASCNDGLACTTSDQCDANGACAGAVVASCTAALGCSTTKSWPGNIDLSIAILEGAFKLSGGALPAFAAKSEGAQLYLIDRTTGTRTFIGGPDYTWDSTQQKYALMPATTSYSARVLPGIYDLLYERGTYTGGGFTWTYQTDATDTLANGEQILVRDLVVGLGSNHRDIDLALTSLSGDFTLNGGALPATADKSEGAQLYLVDTTTGTRVYVGGPDYTWDSGQQKYVLMPATTGYAVKVLPGTYDVLYERGTYTGGGKTWTYQTASTDTLANGEQYLRRNVVVAPGTQRLNLDFSLTALSGDFTLNLGALPSTAAKSEGADFYLIDRTTGTRTYIGGPDYTWDSGQQKYVLVTGSGSYAAKVLPGTYDLLYSRGTYTGGGYTWTYQTDAADTLANGEQLLRTGLVVAAGTQRLNVDFSLTSLTGDFKLNGGALPATAAKSEGAQLYLVDTTTGTRVYIGGPDYTWDSTQQKYALMTATASYAVKVLPGSYDLLYERGTYTGGGYTWTYQTDASDTLANGEQYLARNQAIASGAQARNVDFSLTTLSGNFTMKGGALPAFADKSEGAQLYLVDKTTGTRTFLGGPDYTWDSSQQKYALMPATASYATKILPGTYDLLYERGTYTGGGYTWTYQTASTDTFANGEQLLATNLTIAAGTQARAIDLNLTAPAGNFTFSGGPLPAYAAKSEGAQLYLIDRTTGTRTFIGGPDYTWDSAQQRYALMPSTTGYAAKVLPGVYDLLYERGTYTGGGYTWTYQTDAADTLANGEQLLGRCFLIP